MINLEPSNEERELLRQIEERATLLLGNDENRALDVAACHLNGCALDLQRLLDGADFDFIHDICGISQHLDRSTGRLTRFFSPRFARREVAHV